MATTAIAQRDVFESRSLDAGDQKWRDRVAACRLLVQSVTQPEEETEDDAVSACSALHWFSGDPNVDVRAEARQSILQLRAAGAGNLNPDLARVARSAAGDLSHWRARVRCKACHHLGELGSAAAAHTLALTQCFDDQEEQVGIAARAAVAKLREAGVHIPDEDPQATMGSQGCLKLAMSEHKPTYGAVKPWMPTMLATQLQLFHGVSDEELDARVADLERCLQHVKQTLAEVDASEGNLAWDLAARGAFNQQDPLLTKASQDRNLATSELAKVEKDYRMVIEERNRRERQRLERKRGDYSGIKI